MLFCLPSPILKCHLPFNVAPQKNISFCPPPQKKILSPPKNRSAVSIPGRLGTFQGDYFEDQLFFCQRPGLGRESLDGTVTPMEVEGLYGLEDAGTLLQRVWVDLRTRPRPTSSAIPSGMKLNICGLQSLSENCITRELRPETRS